MVPIYQSHFTADDMTGLLRFCRSPLGQKVITQMPVTMAEGMKVGQQWGRERGEAMIRQLHGKARWMPRAVAWQALQRRPEPSRGRRTGTAREVLPHPVVSI